jgi:hypothetical protein
LGIQENWPLNIFFLLLAAHLLGDVVVGSHRLTVLKRTSSLGSQFIGQGLHSFIHCLLAGILLFLTDNNWITGAVLVLFAHLLIDIVRSHSEIKLFGEGKVFVKKSEFIKWVSGKSDNPDKMNLKNLRTWLLINILDQVCHVISLYIISVVIG